MDPFPLCTCPLGHRGAVTLRSSASGDIWVEAEQKADLDVKGVREYHLAKIEFAASSFEHIARGTTSLAAETIYTTELSFLLAPSLPP